MCGGCLFFFFQAEDGIRDLVRSRGLGDVYKRQGDDHVAAILERGGEAIDFLPAKRSVDLDGRPQFEGFGQGGAIQGLSLIHI